VPSTHNGWLVAISLLVFMAFFAIGPGVCVWLALSELMPTRIRSNGMSIALLVNQAVSTTLAAMFLPTVGKYGYSTMFFGFAACTVIYFITAAVFLPETKGKTLEEIEAHFEGAAAVKRPASPGFLKASSSVGGTGNSSLALFPHSNPRKTLDYTNV
jgi:MFS transporter, SP family, solute carrier family 2 (myo-inositol transporter), member 13